MPLFDYRCSECCTVKPDVLVWNLEEQVQCPNCRHLMYRLPSAPAGFVFSDVRRNESSISRAIRKVKADEPRLASAEARALAIRGGAAVERAADPSVQYRVDPSVTKK